MFPGVVGVKPHPAMMIAAAVTAAVVGLAAAASDLAAVVVAAAVVVVAFLGGALRCHPPSVFPVVVADSVLLIGAAAQLWTVSVAAFLGGAWRGGPRSVFPSSTTNRRLPLRLSPDFSSRCAGPLPKSTP